MTEPATLLHYRHRSGLAITELDCIIWTPMETDDKISSPTIIMAVRRPPTTRFIRKTILASIPPARKRLTDFSAIRARRRSPGLAVMTWCLGGPAGTSSSAVAARTIYMAGPTATGSKATPVGHAGRRPRQGQAHRRRRSRSVSVQLNPRKSYWRRRQDQGLSSRFH